MTDRNAGFIDESELRTLPFAFLGAGVRIHANVVIVGIENVSVGDHSRIDPFTTIVGNGRVTIGSHVHIGAGCYLAGQGGIVIADFGGLSQGVHLYSASDDYSGVALTNPTVPPEFTKVRVAQVTIERHAILGAGAIVLPGAVVAEGCAIGALSMVTRSTKSWSIYSGVPAHRIRERDRSLLEVERKFLASLKGDE